MRLPIAFAARSDVGRERDENQDAFGRATTEAYDVYIVCDGLGGYRGGATASRMAVAAIEDRLDEESGDLPTRLERLLQRANRLVHDAATRDPELRKMATTAVLVAYERETGSVHLAHVGDSRAYLIRGHVIRQLTRDHTVVQRLVEEGVLDPAAAEDHPHSNVISRSVGGEEHVEVEHSEEPLEVLDGDIFLLCSDGLHGLVSDGEMAHTVRSMEPEQAVERLVDRANEEGGHDNITVEVIRFGDMPAEVPDVFERVVPIIRPRRRPAEAETTSPSERHTAPENEAEWALADTEERAAYVEPDHEPDAEPDAEPPPASAPVDAPMSSDNGKLVLTAVLAGLLVAALGIAIMLVVDRDRRVEPPIPVQDIESHEGSG